MRDYDWCNEQDWYDVNDETYDFYCKSSAREMKPRPITVNKPLRVMERQYLPLDDEHRLSFVERLYRFYRDYRVDAERGRIDCSDKDYYCAVDHERYYHALSFGSIRLDGRCVDVTRETKREIFARIIRK